MFEIVDEKDLGRYAVIDHFDVIFWDDDSLLECQLIFDNFGGLKTFRGIYDYQENRYLTEEECKHESSVNEH